MDTSRFLVRRARTALVLASVAVLGLLQVAFSVVPETAAGSPTAAPVVRSFLPEGWAFFTRSPREPRQSVWVEKEPGAWSEVERTGGASPSNLFGVSRALRARNVELGHLYQQAVDEKATWVECEGRAPAACLAGTPVSARLRNHSPSPVLCGTLGISEREPLPWAWAKEYPPETMATRVLHLEVACS
ncbi:MULTISPECIES: SdpA family antimicrobial peptide system protein [Streptomyces]|uniref:SdpA family antimicrobial peptide system protein n=1 Tax=Streptomyces sudanensis TaxID=436397 RepID=A0ABY4TEV2_9ACTN|nr:MULTISPECIES: SdpA family antimicrobial peptide system protein [Streptomyces]MCP9958274.1 SdpA family antimicrobial peptide system protein [Streptomyces sudanensis]MCP9987401.1 SdpA family antimicrobial peptide system protein [Streptomyces sudanensis]MCQ0001205.1 SdpA family antimicrobial peptide system protein [Streptomyces sudanensis]URN16798.1 SdpA family antimicrobial peptide system protein [Streptomyces sudanensis]